MTIKNDKQNQSMKYTVNDVDILNLPDAPDFISIPPQFTVTQMAEICETMLPFWNELRLKNTQSIQKRDPFVL